MTLFRSLLKSAIAGTHLYTWSLHNWNMTGLFANMDTILY